MGNKFKKYFSKILIPFIALGSVLIVIALIFRGNSPVKKTETIKNQAYIGDQYEIDKNGSVSLPSREYTPVSISNFYNAGSNGIYESSTSRSLSSNEIITIEDGLELDAFSKLCNDDTRFLSYRYELVSDIDYDDAADLGQKFIPVGWNGTTFNGLFNGQGFEISNLQLLVFNQQNAETYATMEYVAMFHEIGEDGTIMNFGLIDTDLIESINMGVDFKGVAPLVGANNGQIYRAYVVDNRDASESRGGISASAGYSISGFCYTNNGIIEEAYSYYQTVVNYAVDDYIDFRELVAENNGTITNCYFHSDAIYSSTLTGYQNGHYSSGELTYIPMFGSISVQGTYIYGEYVRSLEELNNVFYTIDGWYTPDTNPDINFGNTMPILKGLDAYEGNNRILEISNVLDFVYMFYLMNKNAYFASSNITYILMNDIDLTYVPEYMYQYDDFFSAKFTGVDDYTSSLGLVGGNRVTTPTLFNPSIKNYINYSGYQCYGLFPLLDGEVSNINIYLTNTVDSFVEGTSSLTKAIGIVSGYVESGTIDKVNVFGNINLSTENDNFGRYIAGGIAGICARQGTIKSVTASGSINGSEHNYANYSSSSLGYIDGNAIGGIVGYVLKTSGEITRVLNNMELTATAFNSSVTVNNYIGGVIGAGYLNQASKLINKANINITDNGNNVGSIYTAGIAGSLFGVSSSNLSEIHNQGDISMNVSSTNTTMISGVMNVNLLASTTGNLLNSSSMTFNSSQITNAGNIYLTNSIVRSTTTADNLDLKVAGVFYLNNGTNQFISNITAAYNIQYKYTDTWVKDFTDTTGFSIDISLVKEFAPCIVSDANSLNALTNLNNVYNLRELTYYSSNVLYFTDVNYSGCVSGEYINYTDVRNQSNITINVLNNATRTATNKSFKVYGVFEEVSLGCSATSIYNAGNLDFNLGSSSATSLSFIYDLYLSGICYANRNQVSSSSEYNKYDPLNSDYENLPGSINNVINNGNVTTNFYSMDLYASSNTSNLGNTVVRGNIISSGITIINEFVISNTFNLGDIYNASYMTSSYTVASVGITYLNIGAYSQVRDSANNGSMKAYNMSKTSYGMVIAAGIVGRNDLLENGTDYSDATDNLHHESLLSFVINYGEVYAFNFNTLVSSAQETKYSIASGILATGLCQLLNTVNYGNVYSSEVASGVFGVVQLYKFQDEMGVNSDVTIANSINYGNVMSIMNNVQTGGTSTDVVYSTIRELSKESSQIALGILTYGQYDGAVIGIINYATSQNGTTTSSAVNYITIRFLINFNDDANVVAAENATPSGLPANITLVTTRANDLFMGQLITYAPLTSISDEDGNIGVFSEDFLFRRAINDELTDRDIATIGVSDTDKYLTDYFQFVGFTKINESLLESIGWRTIAYMDAAERFGKDIESLTNLLNTYEGIIGNDYASLLEKALQTENWISNCDISVLQEILDSILEAQDYTNLQTIIKYLFVDSSYASSITSDLKASVIEYLVQSLNYNDDELRTLLDTLMYDDLYAAIMSSSDSDYDAIKELIMADLETLSSADLRALAETYIDLLNTNNDEIKKIFDNTATTEARKNVLEALLSGINENTQSSILEELLAELNTEEGYSDVLTLTQALSRIDSTTKNEIYVNLITINNTSYYDTVVNAILKKLSNTVSATDAAILEAFMSSTGQSSLDTYTYVRRDYDLDNTVDNTSEVTSLNISLGDSTQASVTDYTAMWNMIKYNPSVSEYLENNLSTVYDADQVAKKGIYALATEYRNSYQSNSSPSGIVGRTRVTETNGILANRYIFTPDDIVGDGGITNYANTYFYGPYTNPSRTFYNYTGTGGGGADNRYFRLFDNVSSSTSQTYVPLFISLDEEYIQNLINSTSNPVLYTFINNAVNSKESSRDQWVSTDIIYSIQKSDCTTILYRDSHFESENPINSLYKYGYDFSTAATSTTNAENARTTTVTGTSRSLLSNADLAEDQAEYYLTAYCTSSLITGIYLQQNQWSTYGAYLTYKPEDATGAHTTAYIDYSVSDLIALDGVRTKGMSSGSVSADEKDIINILMRYILQENEGIELVMNAIKTSASGESVYDNQFSGVVSSYLYGLSLDSEYVENFLEQVIYLQSSIVNTENEELYVEDGVTYTEYLQNFLNPNYSTLEQIILLSTDNSVNFAKVVEFLYNNDTGLYTYLTNTDSFSWLKSYPDLVDDWGYIKEFIELELENGTSESDIINILRTSDITAIQNYINDYESLNSLVVDATGGSDFTINSLDATISTNTVNNTEYTTYLSGTNGTISFTALDDVNTLSLVMASSSGTVDFTFNGQTASVTTTGDTFTYDITPGATYTVVVPENIRIFYVSTIYNGYASVDTPLDISPLGDVSYTGIIHDKTRTVTVSGTTYTGAIYVPSGYTFTLTTPDANRYPIVVGEAVDGSATLTSSYSSSNRLTFSTTPSSQTVRTSIFRDGVTITITGNMWIYNFIFTNIGSSRSYGLFTFEEDITSSTLTNNGDTEGYNINLTNLMYRTNYTTEGLNDTIYAFSSGTITIPTADTPTVNLSSGTVTVGGSSGAYTATIPAGSYVRSITSVTSQLVNIPYTSYSASDAYVSNERIVRFIRNNYSNNVFDNNLLDSFNDLTRSSMGISSLSSGNYTVDGYYGNFIVASGYTVRDESNSVDGLTFSKVLALSYNNQAITFQSNINGRLIVYAKTSSETSNLSLYANGVLVSSSIASANGGAHIFNVSNATEYQLRCSDDTIEIYEAYVISSTSIVNPYTNYGDIPAFTDRLLTEYGTLDGFLTAYDRYIAYSSLSSSDYEALAGTLYNGYKEIIMTIGLNKVYDYSVTSSQTSGLLIDYLTREQIEELITKVASKDNTSLEYLIDGNSSEEELRYIISLMCQSVSLFLQDVMELVNLDQLSAEQQKLFAAAYLSTDFLQNLASASLASSEMKDILSYFAAAYQFINDDNSIDNDKIIELIRLCGGDLRTDGYGIYALSSSEGILNGNFIPDNVDLYGLDTNYELTNGVYSLIDTESNDWRGGDANTSGSVNYAFYVEMKQLKLSIATSVFDIELISTDGTTILTTPTELIDLRNGIISFYLPANSSGNNLTYIINTASGSYSLSYGASMAVTGSSINASNIVGSEYLTTSIVVTAEDTTETQSYEVRLYKSVDMSMSLESASVDNTSSNYSSNGSMGYIIPTVVSSLNGSIDLTFTTNNLPNYTDLADMIYINDKTSSMENSYFSYVASPVVTTNSLVYDTVNRTWGSGSVRINIDFSNSLPGGEYDLEIRLSNNVIYTVTFTIASTTQSSLYSVTYDGVTYNALGNVITSYIAYGRGFSYSELTTVTGNLPTYLDSIETSERALITITGASMILDYNGSNVTVSNGVYSNGIMAYRVDITVTSETGSSTNYIHYLVERDPFADTKESDGSFSQTNYNSNYYIETIIDNELSGTIPDENGQIELSFAREDEAGNDLTPKYRFNYYLDLFYVSTGGSIEDYMSLMTSDNIDASDTDLIQYQVRYYGFYVNFYEDSSAGTYVFNLVYSNSDISWDGTTYSRVITLPSITITKELSTDAFLKEIHFLSSGGQLSDSATIASLSEIYANIGDGVHDYSDLIANPETDVVSNLGSITYNTNAGLQASDYYIVGTVSDAQLQSYAPTFVIKSYSKIYKFRRFEENGPRYLYVEFTYESNNITRKESFYVDESFTNVYALNTTPSSDTLLGTLSNNSFVYDGIRYTVSQNAGTTASTNSALDMDYIGTPEDGHFWYISYVIFSESYQYDNSDNYCKEYHVAVLDMTNNVRFTFTINDDSDVKLGFESLYMTIAAYHVYGSSSLDYYLYDFNNSTADLTDDEPLLEHVYSGFATRTSGTNTYVIIDNYFDVEAFGFQSMPFSYFYFFFDLPDGYGCTYEITTENKANSQNQVGDGSYLPPTSLVTQAINITVTIKESDSAKFVWGEKILAVLPNKAYIEEEI